MKKCVKDSRVGFDKEKWNRIKQNKTEQIKTK